jgi:hypothetical protein
MLHALPVSRSLDGMPGILLTHDDGGTTSVVAGTSRSTTFTLTNAGTPITVNLVATVCNGALALCTVSPSSATLNTGDVRTVTVTIKGGNLTGTGTLTLAAKRTTGTIAASTSVTVTVTPSLTVSTAPHAGTLIDVSGCVADCFETVYDYTTPAYVSRDVPRSVTLRYRSGRARPYGRIALDLIEANPSITAMRLQLRHPNGSYVTFMNGSTSLYFARNTTGPTRVMAEFDASAISTSANILHGGCHVAALQRNPGDHDLEQRPDHRRQRHQQPVRRGRRRRGYAARREQFRPPEQSGRRPDHRRYGIGELLHGHVLGRPEQLRLLAAER